jgi:hypothetical protein
MGRGARALTLVAVIVTAVAALVRFLPPPSSAPVDDQTPVSELSGIGVMCVGADPAGGWDRCAWRNVDGTWRVAEYPEGASQTKWSCRTDAGRPCRQHPRLDHQ